MSSTAEPPSSSAQSTPTVVQTSSQGTSLSSPSFSTPSPNSSTDSPSTPSPESSSTPQVTSSSNAAPTSSDTTPTSSAAASTPTPQSSAAAQTTSTAHATSSAESGSAAASSTSSAQAATTSTSSYTSQVATTLYSTDPAGSIVYLTTSVPEVITTSIPSGPSSSSSSHTGVIVGAVVGGVAGIALLALLLFCIRKRVRKDEFDGNFDPDHVVGRADGGGTLPRVDLADEVTPFPQSYTDQGSSSMRQYGDSPYIAMPSSLGASGQTSPELYASGVGASSVDSRSRQFVVQGAGGPPVGSYAPVNMYGAGAGDWHNPQPGVSPPPSTSSYYTSSTRGAKEREAMGRGQGQGLGLATQPETAEGSADVVVHQDGGRAPIEDHPPPKEIPPAYESIPQD